MLPASPKALSSFLPHSRGNYPLMRENYKRSVWPHAQGPRASGEGERAGRQLETNARGCLLSWIQLFPTPAPTAVPNLDFHGNRFHAWASCELS